MKTILCLLLLAGSVMAQTAESENPTTGPTWTRVGFGASVTGGAQAGQVVLPVDTISHVDDSSATTATALLSNKGTDGLISLNEAMGVSGVRLVKFAVSGDINFGNATFTILNGDLTIDGTGGPNGGICIKNGRVDVRANNVVIRYVRFRSGDFVGLIAGSSDSLDIHNCSGVIIDHCSVSWALDENLTVYSSASNVTIQNSIISEGLHCNTVNPHPEACHSRGLFVQNNATQVTIYHNAILLTTLRTPEISSGDFEYINNVTYGFGFSSPACEVTSTVRGNIAGNWLQISDITDNPGNPFYLRTYDVGFPAANAASRWFLLDNKGADKCPSGAQACQAAMTVVDAGQLQGTPLSFPITSWTSADQARSDVINGAVGASRPCRDSVDTRVMADMVQGTTNISTEATTGGLVNNTSDVGGYPDLTQPCAGAPSPTRRTGGPAKVRGKIG